MAMSVEQLVDGMNLDTSWCNSHLDTERLDEVRFVQELVENKSRRISQFEPHNITCYVSTENEAERVRMIPGYNEVSWGREMQGMSHRVDKLLNEGHSKANNCQQRRGEKMGFWTRISGIRRRNWSLQRVMACNSKGQSIYSRSKVSFQVVSDLHLEVGHSYSSFDIPRAAPYLILAGDIGRLYDYQDYLQFLSVQCAKFEHVYLVLGNHEFYKTSREKGLDAARSLETEGSLRGKLTVLNKRRIDVNAKVTILGCTLQSKIPAEARLRVEMSVSDFTQIEGWTVDDHNAEHHKDVEWLRTQLGIIAREGTHRRILIVTHHAPSFQNTSDPRYKSSPLRSAFCTDLLSAEIPTWPGRNSIHHWFFGHTHWNTEFRVRKITVSSNQRGYVLSERARNMSLGWKANIYWPFSSREGREFDVTKRIQI
jgi:Calcineurin-like phosphoesterase